MNGRKILIGFIAIILLVHVIRFLLVYSHVPYLWLMTKDIPTYPGSSLVGIEYLGSASLSNPGPNPVMSYCYKLSDENKLKLLEETCRQEVREDILEEVASQNKYRHPLDPPLTPENAIGYKIDNIRAMLANEQISSCAYSKFYNEAVPIYKEWLLNKSFEQIPDHEIDFENENARARIMGYASSETYCIEFGAKKFTIFK